MLKSISTCISLILSHPTSPPPGCERDSIDVQSMKSIKNIVRLIHEVLSYTVLILLKSLQIDAELNVWF